MDASGSVPPHYLGVWQRKYLETPAAVDNSSRVYWLQTSLFHADIRIPAQRPAFSDKNSLHDFSLDELKLLASQQGFAGTTSVIGNCCLWARQMDYQPPRDRHDIGFMQFNGDRILETGVDGNYAEIWERLPDSQGRNVAFRFIETNTALGPEKPQAGILVTSGDYFIFARARASVLPKTPSLAAMVNEENRNHRQLIELLDFEISFGRLTQGSIPWEILLSTLPFREGRPLFTEAGWTALSQATSEYVQREQAWNGMLVRRWLV